MAKRPDKPDDEAPDELSYEDFDDAPWDADADGPAIDLDALDGEISAESLDQAAPDTAVPDEAGPELTVPETSTLESISETAAELHADEIAPDAALASGDDTPAPEPAIESDPVLAAARDVTSIETAEPDLSPEVYCALVPLPSTLSQQVIQLRKAGKITTMPPPGIALTAPFRTRERARVEAALAEWARAHLPLQLEITSVLAKVIGTQQYIAAWTLEPEEELLNAQHELRQALADLILPIPGASVTFNAWLPVGDHITAARYPHVIGEMQRVFEPFVWYATDLQLVQQGEPWETVVTFD